MNLKGKSSGFPGRAGTNNSALPFSGYDSCRATTSLCLVVLCQAAPVFKCRDPCVFGPEVPHRTSNDHAFNGLRTADYWITGCEFWTGSALVCPRSNREKPERT